METRANIDVTSNPVQCVAELAPHADSSTIDDTSRPRGRTTISARASVGLTMLGIRSIRIIRSRIVHQSVACVAFRAAISTICGTKRASLAMSARASSDPTSNSRQYVAEMAPHADNSMITGTSRLHGRTTMSARANIGLTMYDPRIVKVRRHLSIASVAARAVITTICGTSSRRDSIPITARASIGLTSTLLLAVA
jgi:hypothetical protein